MITLYHYFLSPFSRKIRLMLEEKNLKFEYNPNLLNYVNIDLNFNLKTNNIASKLKKIL